MAITPQVEISEVTIPIGIDRAKVSYTEAQALIACRFFFDFYAIAQRLGAPVLVETPSVVQDQKHSVVIKPDDTPESIWTMGIKFAEHAYFG